jgi:AcrR family transcriptional regulator
MSSSGKRKYVSRLRTQAAEATQERVLRAAKWLFTRHGIDRVTIAQIAERSQVAASTVYALFKSKEGVLRELMSRAIFGQRFQSATEQLKDVHDPVKLIELTAHVARAIYEGESTELGLLRGASAFSPALRKLEQEFERLRLEMQEKRVKLLFEQAKQKKGLQFDEARLLLWMYTSRDVYRMLVQEGGWTSDQYQRWLAATLVATLIDADHQRDPQRRRR